MQTRQLCVAHCSSYAHALLFAHLPSTHHAQLVYIMTYSMQSCERTDRQHSKSGLHQRLKITAASVPSKTHRWSKDRQDRGPRGHHRYKTTATACLPKTKKQCCARHSTCNCYGVTVSFASAGKACDCPSSQLTDARSILAQAVGCLFGDSLHQTQCKDIK